MANFTHGFVSLKHLADQKVTTVGVEVIANAVLESARLHSQMTNLLLSGLATRTTKWQYNYRQPAGGTLQPADPDGTPVPITTGASYTVSHPIQGGFTAWGGNHVALAKMTVQDALEHTQAMFRQDGDWLRRHLFAGIFYNAAYTIKDEDHGDLTIRPLAITSDGIEYLKKDNTTGTGQHYYAQANAIDDSNNPFDNFYDTLDTWAGNVGEKVAYIPTNVKAAVEGLSGFYEVADPNLSYGSGVTILRNGASIPLFGGELIGYVNKMWIVHLASLPSNYGFAMDTANGGFMAMREHPESSLQGFYSMNPFNINGNHLRFDFWRWAGFSPVNRTAALAYRIGNGTYAPPTAFTTLPLPL